MIKKKISVLMPVYNHASFLRKALGFLLDQEESPDEIVIIDDKSTDDSAAVAEDARDAFGTRCEYRVLRNQHNLGVNATLNRGLAEISGDYVICTAADDWLLPSFIREMRAALEMFPDARLVTSQYLEYLEGEKRFTLHDRLSEYGLWYCEGEAPKFFDRDAVNSLLGYGHVAWPVSASLIKVDALRSVGGFDPDLKWHADWFASAAIAMRHGFCVVPKPLSVFRVADGSYSGGNVRNAGAQRGVCEAIARKLEASENMDLRNMLILTPAPFAPFIRHMLPAAWRLREWDFLIAMSRWWIKEASRGRRPGPLRKFALQTGLYQPPRMPSARLSRGAS